MSHSATYGEFYVTHNGDYSGDIEISTRNVSGEATPVAKLPFWLLAHIVAAKVRQDRIGALEDAGYEELLGMKPKSGPTYD
jgi:hypothetical protein